MATPFEVRKGERRMVSADGIEPSTFSLEGYCSSTELRGHKMKAKVIIRVFVCKQEKTPLSERLFEIFLTNQSPGEMLQRLS